MNKLAVINEEISKQKLKTRDSSTGILVSHNSCAEDGVRALEYSPRASYKNVARGSFISNENIFASTTGTPSGTPASD